MAVKITKLMGGNGKNNDITINRFFWGEEKQGKKKLDFIQ